MCIAEIASYPTKLLTETKLTNNIYNNIQHNPSIKKLLLGKSIAIAENKKFNWLVFLTPARKVVDWLHTSLSWTMSSLDSNGFNWHLIAKQKRTFGMWWTRRFSSWMCSWQICSICLVLLMWTGISEECSQHLDESMPWRIKTVL